MCQLWRGVEMWGWGVYLANDAVEVTEITTARTTEDTAAAETGGILHAHEKVERVPGGARKGVSEIAAADGVEMVAKKEGNNKRGKLEENTGKQEA